jgi:uncharacterized membrane protein HdeD (DUF308 family)
MNKFKNSLGSKKVIPIISIILGVVIFFNPQILALSVALYLVITGVISLLD